MQPTRLHWQTSELELLPQRALWQAATGLLLVADLHLGKAESFQASGIPLPSDGDLSNLNQLLDLAAQLQPQRVVVLGDLIHSRLGLTAELRSKIRALPELLGCPLELIGGNHDQGSWLEGLAAGPPRRCGDLWLSHEPCSPPEADLLNVAGHVHPVAVLGQGSDRLRLPCFALERQQRQLLLPAFGSLTGGYAVSPAYQRWVIADAQVLAVP
ncbi:ligase-associated DNA damage response endonuclease PdeM [Synechococcus sp. CB0101]|jgi:DNA ligase-associated metallophosphoesterase|uniref:ligase-associated DNA damage response endonuclease PdeM n=1 Tax=Synechococcus sp. CB0101 TaxID=232348 RepID=UPI0002001BC7|nr:ligase-associated DNA damage response endonuclease PdeM [Synechococcus sp. CB0101]QCH13852.1 ligase-associated DNA damage response endonuclease PdeM [Synechococcus sp. CB0101]